MSKCVDDAVGTVGATCHANVLLCCPSKVFKGWCCCDCDDLYIGTYTHAACVGVVHMCMLQHAVAVVNGKLVGMGEKPV